MLLLKMTFGHYLIIVAAVIMCVLLFIAMAKCASFFVSRKKLADDGFQHDIRKVRTMISNSNTAMDESASILAINGLEKKFRPTRPLDEIMYERNRLWQMLIDHNRIKRLGKKH